MSSGIVDRLYETFDTYPLPSDLVVYPQLDHWLALDTEPAALHLADLVEYVFTIGEPAEPAVMPTVLEWLSQPAVGKRLLSANCEAALDLWTL